MNLGSLFLEKRSLLLGSLYDGCGKICSKCIANLCLVGFVDNLTLPVIWVLLGSQRNSGFLGFRLLSLHVPQAKPFLPAWPLNIEDPGLTHMSVQIEFSH